MIPFRWFLAGHKFGEIGLTRYTINFGGYNFGESISLHKNSNFIFFNSRGVNVLRQISQKRSLLHV